MKFICAYLKEVWKSKFSYTGKLRNVFASLFPEKSVLQNNLGVHQKQTKVFFIMAIDDHSSLAFELILQPSALNDKLLSRQKTVNAQGTVFNFSFCKHFSHRPYKICFLFPTAIVTVFFTVRAHSSDLRLNSCVITDHTQASCSCFALALLFFALLWFIM